MDMEMIWPGCEPKYFCKGGWTGESADGQGQLNAVQRCHRNYLCLTYGVQSSTVTAIHDLANDGKRFEFFSPANNAGYGKLYVQEVDKSSAIVSEFKDTLGPNGCTEAPNEHFGSGDRGCRRR
jgi:hypothetical protein